MVEPVAAPHSPAPVVDTTPGPVRGSRAPGCAVFLGIPYALPPLVYLRFAAPQPVTRFEEVADGASFDATGFGPPPPRFSTLGPVPLAAHREGEDWLTLNIWTPGLPGKESECSPAGAAAAGAASGEPDPGLPVLVWIHGGAYVDGCSTHPAYDGSLLARAGAVVVTLNYRLGVEGFADFPDAPANRGLLDQVAALAWVRENIAGFGGDPARVTVFGESAGAGSIHLLLTMPAARGLFSRAILQSPPAMLLDANLAAEVTAEFAGFAGVEPTAAGFAALSPAECTDLMARFVRGQTRHAARWGLAVTFAPPLCPVVDGEVVPRDPWEALRDGAASDVEVLIGQTTEEFRFFTAGSSPASAERAAARVELVGPAGRGAEYAALFAEASPQELFEAVQTDRMFTVPTLDAAEAHTGTGGRTFVYVFATQPDGGIGAAHAADIAPVFGNFDGSFAAVTHPRPNADDRELGAAMRQAWVRFAATGDPGWPAWDDTHPVQVYDYILRTDTHPFIDRWRLYSADPARPLGIREG